MIHAVVIGLEIGLPVGVAVYRILHWEDSLFKLIAGYDIITTHTPFIDMELDYVDFLSIYLRGSMHN